MGLLFEEPSRRNCVRIRVCVCVCVCVRTTWNERREEERENVEKERERGGSTFPACNYVGILTVEESFLDRLTMH